MIEYIGWLGGILFAICAIPQALQSIKDKHSDGLNWAFILFWFFGEVLTLIYVIFNPSSLEVQWPLIFNYIFNLICLLIIMRYKIWPK